MTLITRWYLLLVDNYYYVSFYDIILDYDIIILDTFDILLYITFNYLLDIIRYY